jgi:CHAT domain
MIKRIKIIIGVATDPDLCHPVIFIYESSNSQGILLPSSKPLLKKFNKWQDAYSKLTISNRKVQGKDNDVTNISIAELSIRAKQCQDDASEVLKDFNKWLQPTTFSEEIYKQQIDPSDQVQILLQIEDNNLERLPWHLASIFQGFNTEVALFKPSITDNKNSQYSGNNKIKVLAVFGNDKDIDTKKDLEKLKQIPSWDLVSLENTPGEKLSKKKLFDTLDQDRWDIFFFAGHSSSDGKERTGKIQLHDKCDGLTFEEISNAINRSVKKGLKIAFFNSCDGLGLGYSLSKLGVPQIILMKEPVTDIIAQKFLEDFLTRYSQGSSFYQSVRHARENLQRENFLCADWLPTIYQSSRDYPSSWEDLPKGKSKNTDTKNNLQNLYSLLSNNLKSKWQKFSDNLWKYKRSYISIPSILDLWV